MLQLLFSTENAIDSEMNSTNYAGPHNTERALSMGKETIESLQEEDGEGMR